eukprot:g43428.t1
MMGERSKLLRIKCYVFLASNFWFKYPSTSSRLEHFITILHKCFDSPWTTRALSEAVEISGEKHPYRKTKEASKVSFSTTNFESKLLTSRVEPNLADANEKTILDRKEGEQAKAIFEKVKKFKAHVEEKDIIYRLNNHLTAIGDEISELKHLQHLNVSNNN